MKKKELNNKHNNFLIFSFLLIIFYIPFSCETLDKNLLSNYIINDLDYFSFSTLNDDFGFAISSDPHFFGKNSNLQASINILRTCEKYYLEGRIEKLFILGDFFDIGGLKENWIKFLKLKKEISPNIKILSVIGNHDKYFGGQIFWKNIFGSIKSQDFNYGPSSFIWHYSFKNFHFIGLNLPSGFFNMKPTEIKWIEEELNKIPNEDFIVILSHSFFYSSGYKDISGNWFDNKGNIKNIAPIFANKADLVVSGHNHYMEWIEQDDLVWIIVGAMGGKPDPSPSFITKGSKWFLKDQFGFFLIEIKGEKIHCSFQDQFGNILFHKTLKK